MQRVVIEDGRAVGVEVTVRKGGREVIRARREVILAASSINSPKLLMLSGIGPAAHLAEHGIEVVADRPGVGANLQDHLELYIQMAASQPVSLYKYWNLFGKAWVGLQWLLGKRGPGASNQFESCGFIRSAAGVDYPDIQFHFLPIAVRYDGKAAAEGHGFQAHVGPMRSASRGAVTLRSADPADDPVIRFNYMSETATGSISAAASGSRARSSRRTPSRPTGSHEIQPGAEVQSDDELDDFIREHAESAYHPCGTCKMGRADDPHGGGRPRGPGDRGRGLRVADSDLSRASPTAISTRPRSWWARRSPTTSWAAAPLPPDNARPGFIPTGETAQR